MPSLPISSSPGLSSDSQRSPSASLPFTSGIEDTKTPAPIVTALVTGASFAGLQNRHDLPSDRWVGLVPLACAGVLHPWVRRIPILQAAAAIPRAQWPLRWSNSPALLGYRDRCSLDRVRCAAGDELQPSLHRERLRAGLPDDCHRRDAPPIPK